VSPVEFIPVAEQCGAIIEIGAWVIDEACRQAALWPADLYVSINVSPVQLRSVDLLRQITDRPIAEITPAEILTVCQRIEKSGRRDTARRLRGTIGSVFRFAVVTLRAPLDPTQALKGALLKPNVKHRAAITDERELGALMSAIDEYDGWPTLRAALQLLALTMTRPGDVRLMQKSEIVFPKALWRIPAERMKMRRPHDVPLSHQALEVIRGVWDVTPGNGLLLPSVRSHVKPLSENAMNAALRRMG
jgi:integrase